MPIWLLIIATFIVVLAVFFGLFNFPYMPAFLGIYGDEAKSPKGKCLIKLLQAFPVVAAISLMLVWTASMPISSYFIFVPFFYVFCLLVMRLNKQDTAGSQKRFSSKQQNIDEQMTEVEYKWESWQEHKAPAFMCLEIWGPNESLASKLKRQLLQTEAVVGSVNLEQEANNTFNLELNLKIETVKKALICQEITRLIDVIWQYQCELNSVEIEDSIP